LGRRYHFFVHGDNLQQQYIWLARAERLTFGELTRPRTGPLPYLHEINGIDVHLSAVRPTNIASWFKLEVVRQLFAQCGSH